jgi:branched-chain amino acid transport system substrate-binding protein
MRVRNRRFVAALAAVALSGVAIGCGSSSKGATDTPTTAASSKLTGDAVTIGIIYLKDEAVGQDSTRVERALRAAVKAQEARGGIAGRPIDVKVCTAKTNDPNGGAACANQMASDPKVVAIVGSANSVGDAVNPVFAKAGIATIGSLPTASTDYSSPVSFPLMGGAVSGPGAATLLVDKFGVKRISLAYPDIASAGALPVLFDEALKSRGTKISSVVKLPLDKQDLSAEAAQLANNTDAIVITAAADQLARVVQSGRSSGAWTASTKIGTFTSVLTHDVIKSLGSAADGIYAASQLALTDTKTPGVARYLAELKKYGTGGVYDEAEDDAVKNAWLALQVFVASTKGLTTIDRQSVLAAMNTLKYDPEGMAPPFDFSKLNTTVFGGAVARAFNTTVMYGQLRKGKIVSLSSNFVDPFTKP